MRFTDLPTPCFIIDENRACAVTVRCLRDVCAERSRLRRSCWRRRRSPCFRPIRCCAKYLAGSTASGLFEARLGSRGIRRRDARLFARVHARTSSTSCCAMPTTSCSTGPRRRRRKSSRQRARAAGKAAAVCASIPECSTQPEGHAIYDPCAPGLASGHRPRRNFQPEAARPASEGLHFHTLCEQDADDLVPRSRRLKCASAATWRA